MVSARALALAAALTAPLATHCEDRAPRPAASEPPLRKAPPPALTAARSSDPGLPACPNDMVLVEGGFCPAAEQVCVRHHPEYLANRDKSERCIEYRAPSRCLSKRRTLMRYCIDRYEWPNERGSLPRVLTTWTEAASLCESRGKRLCTEDEWLFACEGEAMVPYVNGYVRDPTRCVIDRLYVERAGALAKYDACLNDADCRSKFEKLDQREPAGSFAGCVSPFGAYDMNGNVNEWVAIPDAIAPHRSGLKGGWWGPVRSRCRPTVQFHNEDDWGYEVGFRCCRDGLP